MYGEVPVVVHSFDTYPTNYTLWHPLISNTGNMLMARFVPKHTCMCTLVNMFIHASVFELQWDPLKKRHLCINLHCQWSHLHTHTYKINPEFRTPVLIKGTHPHTHSGSKDGSIHLWTIQGKRPSDVSENEPEPIDQSDRKGVVSHVTCLEGHPAPITSLAFSEEGCLLASGCKAGSVRVWDLQVR